jgi:hypothetical protein
LTGAGGDLVAKYEYHDWLWDFYYVQVWN